LKGDGPGGKPPGFFHCAIRAVSGGKRVAEMQREQSQMRRHEHFVVFV